MYHTECITFILECLSCSHSFQDEVEILEDTLKALYDMPSSCFISFLSWYSATHFLVPHTWSHMHTHMDTNRGAQIYTRLIFPWRWTLLCPPFLPTKKSLCKTTFLFPHLCTEWNTWLPQGHKTTDLDIQCWLHIQYYTHCSILWCQDLFKREFKTSSKSITRTRHTKRNKTPGEVPEEGKVTMRMEEIILRQTKSQGRWW